MTRECLGLLLAPTALASQGQPQRPFVKHRCLCMRAFFVTVKRVRTFPRRAGAMLKDTIKKLRIQQD